MKNHIIDTILKSRGEMVPAGGLQVFNREEAAEGGCGVIGMACSEQVAGRHLLQALIQMRNRGNGKGGGIAAVGLVAEEFGVSTAVLAEDYMVAVAYLNPAVRSEVEAEALQPIFEIDHVREMAQRDDVVETMGLDVAPPEVVVYFVRVKDEAATTFRQEAKLEGASQRQLEDEIVYQNTFRLNQRYYASTGDTHAFVLSHGKNMLVLKMVGYGDDVVRAYQLEDLHAHVWIGHHRYPTKGRVWHPGGAHPFVGMNEALVHNGDFANYAAISEYLAQRHIYPLFLTDTEVSVQVFDLLYRVYGYPLEYVIEALAPTTERDFTRLPVEKKQIYQMLNTTHVHSSPDGPWFFLIAQSNPEEKVSDTYNLIGITDTSMLRPQVFALQDSGNGGPAIGLAASEKQGIDAALESLAAEDGRFWSRADRYWNARGGSYTDGGAFIFSVSGKRKKSLTCSDKFGRRVRVDTRAMPFSGHARREVILGDEGGGSMPVEAEACFDWFRGRMVSWREEEFKAALSALVSDLSNDSKRERAIGVLTRLIDRRYPSGTLRRSSVLASCDRALGDVFQAIGDETSPGYLGMEASMEIPFCENAAQVLVVNAGGYQPEGDGSLALALVAMFRQGFRRFLVWNTRGHRFIGNGFGPGSKDVRIDVYGSPGDYLASGIDGMAVQVHGSVQDQVSQIMKSGKLVVYGDVGQTFGYAAKGGEAYILGNVAGRAMINAVGKPRIVINGTSLDYLAESFMAGNPLEGGGFVVLNGIEFSDQGEINDLAEPYPGGNLFSLASGGAIYIRDPQKLVSEEQLNGGEFVPMTGRDWVLIEPYLYENERNFGIRVADLLAGMEPGVVYRKIQPKAVRVLQAEEAWVHKKDR